MTISLGPSTSQLLMTYDDLQGLGWWSAIALRGKSNKMIIFISAYCLCNQAVTIGSQTAYTQQHTQLIQHGYDNPDP